MHRGSWPRFDRGPDRPSTEVLSTATRAVVLENVNNPTNLGVIARSATAWAPRRCCSIRSCCDPLYRRASGWPWARSSPSPGPARALPRGRSDIVAAGFSSLALTPDPDAEAIDDVVLGPTRRPRSCSAPKARAHRTSVARIGRRIRIPLHGGVDSLNVGAAAAIACYVLGPRTP